MDGALRSDKACRCNQRSCTPLVIHRATAKQSLSQSSQLHPNPLHPLACAVGLSEISLCKLCGKDEASYVVNSLLHRELDIFPISGIIFT